MEPADQLVANVWEPGEYLKIISLAFEEVFENLAFLIRATGRDYVLPFGQSNLVETVFH